jgi:hypothetical protein
LEKSVETMLGFATFPVEVTWLLDGEAWGRRGEVSLVLPAIDAPIQSARWNVTLPRDHRPIGDVTLAAPPDADKNAGEIAWLNAVESYQDNDFEDARGWLEVARENLPEDNNVARLQSNLDVLGGQDAPAKSKADDTDQARRVRDLANARTLDDQLAQDKAEAKAEEALRRGDEVAAAEAYEEVVVLSGRVAVTEQVEAKEASAVNAATVSKLSGLKKAPRSGSGSETASPAPAVPMGGASTVESTILVAPTAPASSTTTSGTTRAPEPVQVPEAERFAYRPPARTLVVEASAFTPVLPPGGPTVVYDQALLLPGEAPSFQLSYRGP